MAIWFDAQDLSEITNVPATPLLRLENKAGPGYATGSLGGGSVYPTLIGVSPIGNKRAVYFNNAGASDEAHLEFFDTPALRPAASFTAFYVGIVTDTDTYPAAGLIAFRGQNDLGTIEEGHSWSRTLEPQEKAPPILKYIAYSVLSPATSASSKASISGDIGDPFYSTAIFKNGSITDFYADGSIEVGSATLTMRELDGDGFIGAKLDTDSETATGFSQAYFGEVLVYAGELSTTDIDAVNSWLADKWGL